MDFRDRFGLLCRGVGQILNSGLAAGFMPVINAGQPSADMSLPGARTEYANRIKTKSCANGYGHMACIQTVSAPPLQPVAFARFPPAGAITQPPQSFSKGS